MTDATTRNQKPSSIPPRDGSNGAAQSKRVVYQSEGQRLLCEVSGSLMDIARSVGASKQSVAWWKSGEKMPGDGFRATLEKIHGIPARTWDKAPTKPGAPGLPTSPSSRPPSSPVDGYDDLIAVCQELLRSGELKAADKLKVVAEVRALRAQHDRQQRHAKKQVSDREIVRSVAWVQLREALGAALKPHPEALAAVVEVLKRLDT